MKEMFQNYFEGDQDWDVPEVCETPLTIHTSSWTFFFVSDMDIYANLVVPTVLFSCFQLKLQSVSAEYQNLIIRTRKKKQLTQPAILKRRQANGPEEESS